MASRSPEEIARIIEEEMPGYTVAEQTPLAAAPVASPDAVGPSLGALRSKYAAADATFVDVSAAASAGADEAATPGDAADDAPEDALVVVTPKGHDPYRAGPGPKAVLISGQTGRIIAHQG